MTRGTLPALVILAGVAAAQARPRTYAVVVAQNRSLDPGVKPLQFADDDGVKTFELFSLFADQVSLFVVPDRDTARLHPEAARRAEVPERAGILERLRRYNRLMAADLERGDDPELFFVYAGHGDVDESGQGYINLHDAKLTRADLYREVIGPSKARFVHVLIDACKSYFMVNPRGGRAWRDDAEAEDPERADRRLRAFLEAEKLNRYPRAGVVVATSGDQETHEWSRYRGGILSHELRSAMSGAADVNADGRVEYSELRAFLAAANARVRHPKARIDVYSKAPALDRHRPLVDLRRARRRGRTRFLRFGPGLTGRFHIEDDRGIRYADLHKEPGTVFDVVVSARRGYYIRRNEMEEASVRRSARSHVDLARLAWAPIAVSARGSVEESFRKDLYLVPYGRRFYEGFIAKSDEVPVDEGAAGFLAPPETLRVHAFSVGYSLAGAPAGDAGLSHAADLRYAYSLRRWLDIGFAAQLGYGRGPEALARQSLTRTALLFVSGATWRPRHWLSLRLDAGVGWQILDGSVDLGGTRVAGTEARGFRMEAGAGLGFDVSRAWGIFLRGGLSVDGVYPADAPAATAPGAFATLGVVFRL
jgi:hypothetical protein